MISLNHNYYHAWDVLGLYRQLFGHVGIPWGPPVKTGSDKEFDERYIGEQTGQPVAAWDGKTLVGVKQRQSDLKGQPFFMPLKIDNYTFPIEPLISVSGHKEVVVTKITNKFPVIEEVAMDNYKVTIKGVYINEDNDDYPYRDVRSLPHLLEKKGSLPVVNKLLEVFGINYLTIVDIKCDGVEGHQSMQWYIIEALSDIPYDLNIKDATI